MAIQAMALGVQNPEINALGALAAGQQARQSFDMNNVQIAKAGLETIGSIALGAMGGNIEGQADPALFNEGLDYLAQQGVDVEQFRDRADLAPVIARSSMTALQQIQTAQDERSYQLALDKFEQDVMQAAQGPASSFSQTPIFLEDPEGNQHLAQMSSGGGVLLNGKTLPGIPQGWKAVNRPQALTTINDGSQISAFDPNLGAGTVAPLATVQGDPSANMNVTIDPEAGRVMTPAPGSEQATERNAARAKAESALRAMETKNTAVTSAIDKALNDSSFWTTGIVGSIASAAPGSPAFDLGETLKTIKGNLGFEELQTMRDNSPTGGALGSVTERELAFLQSTITSIEQAQSEEQLRTNLQTLKDYMATSKANRQQAFDQTFSASQGAPAAPTEASPAKPTTQEEYDALPAGAVFIDPDDGQTYRK
jgi:hypothetical protein